MAATQFKLRQLQQDGASTNDFIRWDGSNWAPDTVSIGDILNGGNTTGATVVIGTNDANALELETNNVTRLSITGGASTGGAVTVTNITSNTNTVQDILTLRTNSTGSATTDFGGGILFQGENSAADNRDMVRIAASWTTATDASHEAKLSFQLGNAGGALTEIANFNVSGDNAGQLSLGSSNAVTLSPSALTTATNFTVGNSSADITIGGTASTGNVIINNITPSTTGAISIGSGTTSTTGVRVNTRFSKGYNITSGSNPTTTIRIDPNFENSGGSTGITRTLHIVPNLTTVADFRGIDLEFNDANAKGIYQAGSNTINNFQGPTTFGTVSAPNASAIVDVVSTTKGFGLPSMTSTERDAISSPRDGLLVYNSTDDFISVRANGVWVDIDPAGDGNGIYGGSGTIPNNTVATLTEDGDFTINWSTASPAITADEFSQQIVLMAPDGASGLSVISNSIAAETPGTITLSATGSYLSRVIINDPEIVLSVGDYVGITGASSAGPDNFPTLRIYEKESSGTNYVGFTTAAMAASSTYTLPTTAAVGLLHNDGSNVWSWSTASNADLASGVGGIYKGSGSIPDGTEAALESGGLFYITNFSSTPMFVIEDGGAMQLMLSGGELRIGGAATATPILLMEPSGSGVNYTGFVAGAMATNQVYTLPTDAPADGEFLRWNTGGTLDWAAPSGADGNGIYTGSGNIASATVATIADESTFTIDYFDGSNALHFVDNGETFSLTSGAAYGINANSSQVQMIGPNSDYVSVTSTGPIARGGLSITNGYLSLPSDISPAQITADQNDYSPTGLDDASVLRLTSDASRTITGIDASVKRGDGDLLTIINVGSNNIILSDDDASSSATNRMFLGGTDITLSPEFSVTLIYDDTSNVWRPFNLTSNGAADGNGIYSGSGTIDGSATATLETGATFTIAYFGANPAIQVNDADESVVLYDKDGVNYVYVDDLGVDVYGVHSIILNTTPSSDHYASGTKITLTANENQAFGDAVYINTDGEAQLADADALATAKVIGICTETVTANNPGTYLIQGIARDDTWAWTVGGYVYLSTTGTTGNTLTQTAPTATDDCVVIVGIASHADRMIVNPSYSITVLE